RDPRSVAAWQGLAQAQMAMGDTAGARASAGRATGLDERDPRSFVLLGDAQAASGDRLAAIDAYKRSLLLRPDASVEQKLGALATAPPSSRAQSRRRYDGGVNEALGTAVLEVLAGAYDNYASRLRFRPEDPITVILELGTSLQEPGAPEWAAGLNDGT